MATVSSPLNAEPALPEDRAKQHLPPKSYAAAVEEEAPKEVVSGVNGTNGAPAANGSYSVDSDDMKKGHRASVLRIVDTGAPAAEEKKEGAKGERPQWDRQESQHEYSATVCSAQHF
jgi:2-acylglycerol O-acyltransferase 2